MATGSTQLPGLLGRILEAMERIHAYVEDVDEAGFLSSKVIQDAVIRNLEVIGEASCQFESTHPEIPLALANDVRNVLARDYGQKELKTVWRMVQKQLSDLHAQINLLAISTRDGMIETLERKIQKQEGTIAQLQAAIDQALKSSPANLLGQLRLRGAFLLYVEPKVVDFEQQIAKYFDSDVAWDVMRHLFVLDRAPVPPEVRDAIRKAANHGMCVW